MIMFYDMSFIVTVVSHIWDQFPTDKIFIYFSICFSRRLGAITAMYMFFSEPIYLNHALLTCHTDYSSEPRGVFIKFNSIQFLTLTQPSSFDKYWNNCNFWSRYAIASPKPLRKWVFHEELKCAEKKKILFWMLFSSSKY